MPATLFGACQVPRYSDASSTLSSRGKVLAGTPGRRRPGDPDGDLAIRCGLCLGLDPAPASGNVIMISAYLVLLPIP